jgi:hypothetical protein
VGAAVWGSDGSWRVEAVVIDEGDRGGHRAIPATTGPMGRHGSNKIHRVVLGPSLRHVGQRGTSHTFIRAVSGLALWPDLQD